MREIVDMGDNRENKGTNRDGKTDRDGILHNVFCEAIFNAVGILLESEDEGRETNTREVKKRHFDWRKRVS